MNMDESRIERRKFQRHTISEGSLFICDHGSNNLVAVKNISSDGLQFVYFPDKCNASDCGLIDIMQHSGCYFCVAGVCCRIVYDIPSLAEDLSFSGIRTRVAGVEFADLTEKQQEKLSELLAVL